MSYFYFISTLPSLSFNEKPPVSSDAFLESASEWLPPADWQALKSAASGFSAPAKNKTAKLWKEHEEILRNLLAMDRAQLLKKDQSPFINKANRADSAIRSVVQEAIKSETPANAEEIIDKLRWNFLDEISAAHSFDFNIALAYLLKLKILERRANFDEETGKETLDKSIITNA